MKSEDVLKLPMRENDADADNIGEYLAALLCGVIVETEGFSGKRPFGNSGWYSDLKFALVKGKAVMGKIVRHEYDDGDFEEYAEDVETAKCDRVLVDAIRFALTK